MNYSCTCMFSPQVVYDEYVTLCSVMKKLYMCMCLRGRKKRQVRLVHRKESRKNWRDGCCLHSTEPSPPINLLYTEDRCFNSRFLEQQDGVLPKLSLRFLFTIQ